MTVMIWSILGIFVCFLYVYDLNLYREQEQEDLLDESDK